MLNGDRTRLIRTSGRYCSCAVKQIWSKPWIEQDLQLVVDGQEFIAAEEGVSVVPVIAGGCKEVLIQQGFGHGRFVSRLANESCDDAATV